MKKNVEGGGKECSTLTTLWIQYLKDSKNRYYILKTGKLRIQGCETAAARYMKSNRLLIVRVHACVPGRLVPISAAQTGTLRSSTAHSPPSTAPSPPASRRRDTSTQLISSLIITHLCRARIRYISASINQSRPINLRSRVYIHIL